MGAMCVSTKESSQLEKIENILEQCDEIKRG